LNVSNIKIVFLPANTTYKLQPLDLARILRCIIKSYCFIAKIDECSKATEVIKKITILQAIRWVDEVWEKVSPNTIKKCFKLSGILDS